MTVNLDALYALAALMSGCALAFGFALGYCTGRLRSVTPTASPASSTPGEPRDESDRSYDRPIGYLPAYELGRLNSGHDANLRSAKFGPSPLDRDIPVYLEPAKTAPEATADGGLGLGDTPPEAVRVMMEALAPGPMTEAPAVGTRYWMPSRDGTAVSTEVWDDDYLDRQWLAEGRCHASEAAALHSLAGGK